MIADAPQIKDAIFDPVRSDSVTNHHDPHTRRQRCRRHANLPGHSCNPTPQYGSICSGCWLPATAYWLPTTDYLLLPFFLLLPLAGLLRVSPDLFFRKRAAGGNF